MLHPTLFIVHLLDQLLSYLVLHALSINSLGCQEIIQAVYTLFMGAQSLSKIKDIRVSVTLSLPECVGDIPHGQCITGVE
jgi:hypothetical protein